MSIDALTIVGERINPGFKSSKALLDAKDLDGLAALAVDQVQKGATYLTINVGEHASVDDPRFLLAVIQAVQDAVDVPLSFDYPHQSVQRLCLETYDPAKANGHKPIVNSIAEARWDMLELVGIQPFKLVMMASERCEGDAMIPNRNAPEVHQTAKRMVSMLMEKHDQFEMDDMIIDVSLASLGADTEGLTRMAVDSIKAIGADRELDGTHRLVGLSNLSIMLPKLATDGSLLKVGLESAFLTETMPHGLDMVLGTPGRDYQILPDDNFILQGFREAIALDGFDTLMRVQELYTAAVL